MKLFLLTYYGQHRNWNTKTEADWNGLNQKYMKWMEKLEPGLKATGKLASKPTKVLMESRGELKVTDGPYDETREVLTGFYFIEAEDMNHPVDIAKGSPWLLHDKMEIFEVEIGRSK